MCISFSTFNFIIILTKIFVKRKCDVILYIFLKISIIAHNAVFVCIFAAFAAACGAEIVNSERVNIE